MFFITENGIVHFFATGFFHNVGIGNKNIFVKEVPQMKGFYVGNGYMGLVEGKYMLFISEEEYEEYLRDE